MYKGSMIAYLKKNQNKKYGNTAIYFMLRST